MWAKFNNLFMDKVTIEFIMKISIEIWAAILLGIVLLLSICNELVGEIKNNNFENQVEQDLDLSKAYGETNARWLEVNELLQRNLAIALEGLWDKTVEESGKFHEEDFSEEEWNYWKGKTVGELWEHDYGFVSDNLRKSLNETNEKRNKQEDFIIKNKPWNFIESLLRILQISFLIGALVLYFKVIKNSRI